MAVLPPYRRPIRDRQEVVAAGVAVGEAAAPAAQAAAVAAPSYRLTRFSAMAAARCWPAILYAAAANTAAAFLPAYRAMEDFQKNSPFCPIGFFGGNLAQKAQSTSKLYATISVFCSI